MTCVLIIVQNLPVPYDRRVWLEALTLRDAGYHVQVICPTGQYDDYQTHYEVLSDIAIYRYPVPPDVPTLPGYLFEFVYCWMMTVALSLWVWMRHDFDIIHVCNPPETYFLLGRFYQFFGKRFIFDHHDLSPEMYVAKGGRMDGGIYWVLRWMEMRTYRTANVIITTNRWQRELAGTRTGIALHKVYIVRTGPDFDRLQPVPPDIHLKQGRTFLVCYLGEMGSQDGINHLLQMIQQFVFQLQRHDTQFLLIGGGSEWKTLHKLMVSLGLAEFVTMVGRVSDNIQLSRYLSSADVCVDAMPDTSYANYASTNKVGEYMALGKPMVLTDLKEHRCMAGDAAVYVPHNMTVFAGTLASLLDNPERRDWMGQAGLKRVHNKLAWHYSQPHLLEAYAAALNRAGTTSQPSI